MRNKEHTIHNTLLSFLLMLSFGAVAQGQNPTMQQNDMLYITSRDNANYDSLLNNYYWRKYSHAVNRHYSRSASEYYAAFDQIPDSVLEKRLRQLPTVIPMTYNQDVRAYIRTYIRIMERRCDVMLTLSEYYFPLFEEVLDRYKVPQELKYLSIVESALNPQATSRAGAAGLWQFMYRTGKHYDLDVNSLVDDRRDPYASTVAAARYLRDLNNIYHDWTLAIAAYNCGPGNINKAIARSGGKRNFWEIYQYLPRETRGYIPAFIGACYAMNYYHEHGIRPQHINVPIHSDTVHLDHDAFYCYISQYIDIEVEELRTLNPQYRADIVPASNGHKVLYLPVGKIPTFIKMEDSIYKATNDSVTKKPVVTEPELERIVHIVKRGETLTKVANRYGVSTANIKRWSHKRSNSVKVGERLIIYRKNPRYTPPQNDNKEVTDSLQNNTAPRETETSKPSQVQQPKPATPAHTTVKHTVRKGDTLSSIARKYGTTIDKIKRLNNLHSDKIRIGQVLIIKK